MPFKAIISRDEGEPWGDLGMNSYKWLNVDTELVRISDLIATQKGVFFQPLMKPTIPVGGDYFPHVVYWRGEAYLEDGHHRVIRAALAGNWLIEARVLQVDG